MVRPAWVAVIAAATGCADPDQFSGDPFPIAYVSRAGAVTVEVRATNELPRAAVLDVMSPLTVLDNGLDTDPARRFVELDVLGVLPAGGTVPRARLSGTVLQIHPCAGEATCGVGDPVAPFAVAAVLGTDLLAGDALRLDFAASQLYLLPDIAGDAALRTLLCDGVFPRPFQGAGTLVLEGAEVAFSSRRIVVEACLAPDAAPTTPSTKRGGDALFVISTGLGANLLTESAYLRYRDGANAVVPDLLTLPEVSVRIVSGPISGRLGTVPAMAIVATAPKNPRGPCREAYASSYLETADPLQVCPAGIDCPCRANDRSCSAPAVVRLTPAAGIPVVIVSDEDPLLQSLRAELRPLVGEIDGVIGTDVLAPVELDVDYPHDRLLWRCAVGDGCQVRPEVDGFAHQIDLQGCVGTVPVTRR